MKTLIYPLLIGLILLLNYSNSSSQSLTFDWAKSTNGSGYSIGKDLTVDQNGNVYTIGNFEGTVDFDPDSGIYNLTSLGQYDVFIQKLNAKGKFIWAKKISGKITQYGYSITIDLYGHIYASGAFRDSLNIDPNLSKLVSNGGFDCFVLKLDTNGNFIWGQSMGGNYKDLALSITTDSYGNVYTVGDFQDTVDFDFSSRTQKLVAKSTDAFIQKLDSSGNLIWAKQIAGSYIQSCSDIVIDGNQNLLITGGFQSTADFDPDTTDFKLTTNNNNLTTFILKLDVNGNFLWAKQTEGIYSNLGISITIDNLNNVITAGNFRGTIDFDPDTGNVSNLIAIGSSFDGFIQKLDSNGNYLWAISVGGIGSDLFNSITTDVSGNLYSTGYFQRTVDFDPSAATLNLTALGIYGMFIQKISPNGSLIWVKLITGTGAPQGQGINIDLDGNIYTTGGFTNTVDFDPGIGVNNITTYATSDIFVQKLKTNTVGLHEESLANDISFYPNPASNSLVISKKDDVFIKFQIHDITGKVVIQSMTLSKNVNILDLSGLNNGIYLIQIEKEGKIYTEKLLISK